MTVDTKLADCSKCAIVKKLTNLQSSNDAFPPPLLLATHLPPLQPPCSRLFHSLFAKCNGKNCDKYLKTTSCFCLEMGGRGRDIVSPSQWWNIKISFRVTQIIANAFLANIENILLNCASVSFQINWCACVCLYKSWQLNLHKYLNRNRVATF